MRNKLFRPKKGELLRLRKHLYGNSGGGWSTIKSGTIVMFLKKLESRNSDRHYLVLHKGRTTEIILRYYERNSAYLEPILWL